ncbi:MAG: glycosyltransferase family 39 protein [Bdellovibrionota bacterium]
MLTAKAYRLFESGKFLKAAAVAVAIFSVWLSYSASRRMSVTIDEFQALPSGLAMLESGDYRFPKGTPPLSQLLGALPSWIQGERLGDITRNRELTSWGIAHVFANRLGTNFPPLYSAARTVSSAAFLLLLALLFGYAKSLYGDKGALLAVVVAGFCPNLLGHGSLLTPDIYLAAALVGFLWSLDSLLRRPGIFPALAIGFSLGIAASVKFTGLLFFMFLPLLVWAARADRKTSRVYVPVALILGWFTVLAVYAFDGAFSPLSRFAFESPLFRLLQLHLPGALPVPFPFHFVRALDEQLAELPYPAYLLGRSNLEGFYSYYLVALLVKTPVATLLLAALAAFKGGRPSPRERSFLYVALALLLFFSFGRYKNIGVRYVLFLFPLIALWCGRLARGKARVVAGLLAFLVAESLWSRPDYIAYFNFASGGTSFGHHYLLDSNLDWGQGLVELKEFLTEKNIPKVSLAYAGRVRPELYGIGYELFPGGTPSLPVVAISANLLWGRGYFVNGTSFWPKDPDTYAVFRNREPLAVLGGSIYLYKN